MNKVLRIVTQIFANLWKETNATLRIPAMSGRLRFVVGYIMCATESLQLVRKRYSDWRIPSSMMRLSSSQELL